MRLLPALGMVTGGLVLSCAELLDLGAYGAGSTSATGSAGSSQSSANVGGAGAGGAQQGGGGTGGGCVEGNEEAVLVADTFIMPTDCNGANHWGVEPHIMIGPGRALLRFILPPEAEAALQEARVTRMELALTRDIATCTSCVGDGPLQAHPLMNDWDQGTIMANYDGADWCRRKSGSRGLPWSGPGADGQRDVGAISDERIIDSIQGTVVFDLDPGPHQAWIDGSQLSVRIAAGGEATLVAVSSDSPGPLPAPRLVVFFCSR